MATNPSYCVHTDVKDVYPQIDEFDTKTAIYGWTQHTASGDQDIWYADNTGLIPNLYRDGKNLTATEETSLNNITGENEWYYDSQKDRLHLNTGVGEANKNPNDMLIEGGEDWNTHVTDIIRKSSAYLDSRIDANLPRRQFKNSDGEYDYLIIRTTALITASFLIKAHNPMSELLEKFEEEYNFNIELINSGKSKLSYQVSGDSSKGYIKEIVSPQTTNANGGLYIVDTRGHYSGTYDRIKVAINTTGIMGVATYDVEIKDSTRVKNNKVVENEIINGDYQDLAGGLQIRFQGKNDSSIATQDDEWEIEVFGTQESLDDNIGAVKYTSMTRTSRPFRKGYGYRI
tara:strand:+ start:71 stop:1102 length:1032 start_codon:yes stop_codon:yes gene_type:complete